MTDHDAARIEAVDLVTEDDAGLVEGIIDLLISCRDPYVLVHSAIAAVRQHDHALAADAQYQQQHAPDLDALLDSVGAYSVAVLPMSGDMYRASVTVQGRAYLGSGPSRMAAIRAAVASATKGQGDE